MKALTRNSPLPLASLIEGQVIQRFATLAPVSPKTRMKDSPGSLVGWDY